MDVGEVRAAEFADFEKLITFSHENEGWTLAARKSHCCVYTRSVTNTQFKMVKIVTTVCNVEASAMYDCLHDSAYRSTWDTTMNESREICVIDAENDIGYYQVRTPAPLKNRDFVTQRSWRQDGKKFMIINHSVYHKGEPPRKNIIRGTSYYTGYLIESASNTSCQMTYISHSNPGGNLPPWLVNKLLTVVAPKVVKRLMKAGKGYRAWKAKNNPQHMPWRWPDQITSELIDWDDVEGVATDTGASQDDEEVTTPGAFTDQMLDDNETED